jgi:hypothetical protein
MAGVRDETVEFVITSCCDHHERLVEYVGYAGLKDG